MHIFPQDIEYSIVPLGDHLTQVAARLIRKMTNVGFHFPSCKVHTYAFRSLHNGNKISICKKHTVLNGNKLVLCIIMNFIFLQYPHLISVLINICVIYRMGGLY